MGGSRGRDGRGGGGWGEVCVAGAVVGGIGGRVEEAFREGRERERGFDHAVGLGLGLRLWLGAGS